MICGLEHLVVCYEHCREGEADADMWSVEDWNEFSMVRPVQKA